MLFRSMKFVLLHSYTLQVSRTNINLHVVLSGDAATIGAGHWAWYFHMK